MFITKTQKRIRTKFILLRVYVQRPYALFVTSPAARHWSATIVSFISCRADFRWQRMELLQFLLLGIFIWIPSERILFFKMMCRSVSAPYSGGGLTYESFCVSYFLKAVLLVYSWIAKGHCNRASFKDRHFALSHHTVQIIFYKSDCCECIKCVCLSIAHDYCCYVVLMC